MASMGLHLHEFYGSCWPERSDVALAYITLKEVVDLAGAAAKLADLCFDIGKGYKRFDTLKGFCQTFWAECLKSKRKKNRVYYVT